jgi:hypothetical protein
VERTGRGKPRLGGLELFRAKGRENLKRVSRRIQPCSEVSVEVREVGIDGKRMAKALEADERLRES